MNVLFISHDIHTYKSDTRHATLYVKLWDLSRLQLEFNVNNCLNGCEPQQNNGSSLAHDLIPVEPHPHTLSPSP